jgi:hypothetical protein
MGTHDDAHCMGCRRAWTREVLDAILLTTWINGDYKKHREDILFDRERSRLPAAQIIVERRREAQKREPLRVELIKKIADLEVQIGTLRSEYYLECQRIDAYMRGEDPFAERTEKDKAKSEERRVFVMPCPAADCRGFLSSGYKCGVCDIHVCPECREIKGVARDVEHTCNPNTVETVRLMKKECRGCPECGTNIFKIEGCDQMFCTHCNTPFSWTTGKKITNGVLHNPHYFEYLRLTNGGAVPRNPGDIPCIANLPNAWTFDRQVAKAYPGARLITGFLYAGLNTIAHIQHVEIPHMTNHAQDSDTTEINVRYLMGEVDQKHWKQLLQQKEKKRIKKDEIRMRYEAFVGACVDIYGRLMTVAGGSIPTDKAHQEKVHVACDEAKCQLLGLRGIFNEGLMDISKRYKCQVLQLNEVALKRETKKYETGRAKRVKKTDADTVGTESIVDDEEIVV